MSIVDDERVSDEIEALEAILLDDVRVSRAAGGHVIETVVHPSTGERDTQYVCLTLAATLPAGYPDVRALVSLRNPRGLDDAVLGRIRCQVDETLDTCLGQPVVFELIDLIKEKLTESNQPSGTCAICLYGFASGDAFTKTQCYHHFHSHCLASHLQAAESNYEEEMAKLPHWQHLEAAPYQATCPVCRATVSVDVAALRTAPPPRDSAAAPPFRLTPELKALQREMAALLARQTARGGTVGSGDSDRAPLVIGSDHEEAGSAAGGSRDAGPAAPAAPAPAPDIKSNGHTETPTYKGPYRGFNRRGNPGRRGRGRGGATR